jgi:hypothetical protein
MAPTVLSVSIEEALAGRQSAKAMKNFLREQTSRDC